jgi:hypothetical protein
MQHFHVSFLPVQKRELAANADDKPTFGARDDKTDIII